MTALRETLSRLFYILWSRIFVKAQRTSIHGARGGIKPLVLYTLRERSFTTCGTRRSCVAMANTPGVIQMELPDVVCWLEVLECG